MRWLATALLVGCGVDRLGVVPRQQPLASEPPTVETNVAVPVLAPVSRSAVLHNLTAPGCTANGSVANIKVGVAPGPSDFGPVVHRAILAIDEIPDGEILSWRLLLHGEALGPGAIEIYRMTDGNDWVAPSESMTLAPQAGAADWWHKQHPAEWESGIGGLSNDDGPWANFATGEDYDSGTVPPTVGYAAGGGSYTAELPAEWLTDWRDGLRDNNGMLLRERAPTMPYPSLFIADTESVTFEIDVGGG